MKHKIITKEQLYDILGMIVAFSLSAIVCFAMYRQGLNDGQEQLLKNRQVECEVIDYTTKDGFFKAVREGVAVRLIEK